MKTDFRPPMENRLLIRSVYLALPLIMRVRRVVGVQIPDQDWDHLARLRNQRLILSANHPTGTDPLIAMALARKLGQPFNFVAARENFDGPYGWLLQRLGVYSILRGSPDRDSLRTSRQLLTKQDRKVAIFPEGETYYHNDITLPFHSGVTQLGFWALADLQKLGKDPQLPIVPVAIKYRFVGDPRPEIEERIRHLEEGVGITGVDTSLYDRLVAIGQRVVTGMEREYGLEATTPSDLGEKINRIKEHILHRVASQVGEPPAEIPLPEQMRFLFNALRTYASEFLEASTPYERRLHQRRMDQVRPLFDDLWRLHACLAMTGHYVRDHPTCERFSDVLSRLEEEVFGHSRIVTPVEALVRIAQPVELSEWLPQYRASRRSAVDAATRVLEDRVVSCLRDLRDAGQPLLS